MFLGLDMAWSDHNLTGACAVDADGRVIDEQLLATDDEIVAWVGDHVQDNAVVAADIPLTVPNRLGARVADREVASVYGARHAGPHPANRTLFEARFGRIRGEQLRHRLAELGFVEPFQLGSRVLLEVYPHPGLIEVFDLPGRHEYKKGSMAERKLGLWRLRRMLQRLEHTDPPLVGPHIVIPRRYTGDDLKRIEDRLDARFCAWAASVWERVPGGIRIFGQPEAGHIAVPIVRAG